jgi:Protein of unknown function (DUF2889)
MDIEVFERGDGLWEIEAQLKDTRTSDFATAGAVRVAGDPVHHMRLRLVINEKMDVLQAGSDSHSSPYPGHCGAHNDAYGQLVGLNLMQDFRRHLRKRLGGTLGCTHITELAQSLPSAAVQAFAGQVIDTKGLGPDDPQPFQINRCHALRNDSEAVRLYYPKWFTPADGSPSAPLHSPSAPSAPSAPFETR